MADLKYQTASNKTDHLLKMVKPIVEKSTYKGKIDDNAINAVLDAFAKSQENQEEYQRLLLGKSNDALINELSKRLKSLYDAQKDSSSSEESPQDKSSIAIQDQIDALKSLVKEIQEQLKAQAEEGYSDEDAEEAQDELDKKLEEIKDINQSALNTEKLEKESSASFSGPESVTAAASVPEDTVGSSDIASLKDFVSQHLGFINSIAKGIMPGQGEEGSNELKDFIAKGFDGLQGVFKTSLMDRFSELKTSFGNVTETLNKPLEGLKDLKTNIKDSIHEKLAGFKKDLKSNILSKISGGKFGGANVPGIGGTSGGAFGKMFKSFGPIMKMLGPILKLLGPILKLFKPLMKMVKKIFPPIMLIEIVMKLVDKIFDSLETLINFVVDVIYLIILIPLKLMTAAIFVMVSLIFVALAALTLLLLLIPIAILAGIIWIGYKIYQFIDYILEWVQYIIDVIMDTIDEWIYKIKNWWKNTTLAKWWNEDVQKAGGLGSWLIEKIKAWWDNICKIAEVIKDVLVSWYEKSVLKTAVDKVSGWIETLFGWIKEIYEKIVGTVKKAVENTKEAAAGVVDVIKNPTDPFGAKASAAALQQQMKEMQKLDSNAQQRINSMNIAEAEKQLKYLQGRDMKHIADPELRKALLMQRDLNISALKKRIDEINNANKAENIVSKPLEVPSAVNADEIKKQAEEAVSQQAEPLATIKAAQEQANQEAHEANEQMTEEQKKKDEQQQQYQMMTLHQGEYLQNMLSAMNDNLSKKLDNPNVVPVPLPYKDKTMTW